jgi:hypothetical protein
MFWLLEIVTPRDRESVVSRTWRSRYLKQERPEQQDSKRCQGFSGERDTTTMHAADYVLDRDAKAQDES